MRLHLKVVNDELARRGYSARLAKGDGHFYFTGGEAEGWLDGTVKARTINTLTLKQWIEEFRAAVANWNPPPRRHFLKPVLAATEPLQREIKKRLGVGADTIGTLGEEASLQVVDERPEEDTDLDAAAEDASIIRFVNQVLRDAIELRASDIHLEPFEDELRIRYRIDGVLHKPGDTTTVRQYVDVDPTTLNTEFIKVQSQFIRNHVNPMVIVKADKDARYGTIKKIMDTLQDININRFSLMTEIERRQAPASPGSAG